MKIYSGKSADGSDAVEHTITENEALGSSPAPKPNVFNMTGAERREFAKTLSGEEIEAMFAALPRERRRAIAKKHGKRQNAVQSALKKKV